MWWRRLWLLFPLAGWFSVSSRRCHASHSAPTPPIRLLSHTAPAVLLLSPAHIPLPSLPEALSVDAPGWHATTLSAISSLLHQAHRLTGCLYREVQRGAERYRGAPCRRVTHGIASAERSFGRDKQVPFARLSIICRGAQHARSTREWRSRRAVMASHLANWRAERLCQMSREVCESRQWAETPRLRSRKSRGTRAATAKTSVHYVWLRGAPRDPSGASRIQPQRPAPRCLGGPVAPKAGAPRPLLRAPP